MNTDTPPPSSEKLDYEIPVMDVDSEMKVGNANENIVAIEKPGSVFSSGMGVGDKIQNPYGGVPMQGIRESIKRPTTEIKMKLSN